MRLFIWLEEPEPEEYKASAIIEPPLQIVNVPISFAMFNNSLLASSGRKDLRVVKIIVEHTKFDKYGNEIIEEKKERFELRLNPRK